MPLGTLGFPWAPLRSLLRPLSLPLRSFGSPRVHLGSHGNPLGLPRGHRGIQLYKQTPGQPPKRPDVNNDGDVTDDINLTGNIDGNDKDSRNDDDREHYKDN